MTMMDSNAFLNKLMGTPIGKRIQHEVEVSAQEQKAATEVALAELEQARREEARRYRDERRKVSEACDVARRALAQAEARARDLDDAHFARVCRFLTRDKELRSPARAPATT